MSSIFELGFLGQTRELTLEQLPVIGRVPEWLEGTLVRNGPGTFDVGTERYRHWFDGLSMLHKFSFSGGQVSYANKFLQTQSYRSAMERGRISYSEFATDPCRSLFSRIQSVFSPTVSDNAKVSIARVAEKYLALAETPIQVEFDLETLRTAGVFTYEDEPLTGQMTTVHPIMDPEENNTYNLVTRYHAVSHYRLYRVGAGGARTMVGQVPSTKPAYMHSFGMTKHYAIFTEFPLRVQPMALLLWLRPYIENFTWEPKRGTPFYVLDRHTGELVGRWDADPFFAFHHVNAWEEGDDIVLDIDAYEDNQIIDAFFLDRLANSTSALPFGHLRRYRIPLKGKKNGRLKFDTLSDECAELARFDTERYLMDGAYRYVYASSINKTNPNGFYNQIVKIDVKLGKAWTWYCAGHYPGEPVFVGRPGRTRDDDGVLLSVVLDANAGTSYLLVLDAGSLGEIGRAPVPHPILFGYHGEFFKGAGI
jgi:beta,beta-carotene 9',10'-dioxygenase